MSNVDKRTTQLRIAILSSFAAGLLPSYLEKALAQSGLSAEFYMSDFGQYQQPIRDPQSDYYFFQPTHTLLLLEGADLFRSIYESPFDFSAGQIARAVEEQMVVLKSLLEQLEKHLPTHVTLLHTIVVPPRNALRLLERNSDLSLEALAAAYNQGLSEICHGRAQRYVVDLAAVAMEVGYERWTDERLWILARMRLSHVALMALAQREASFLKAMRGERKKCLVLDLDNTLWGGVVGEDGAHGIVLGTDGLGLAYRQFQMEILNLYKQGILLAICSKNNEADALEVLERHPGMVLRPEHFAAMQINWRDKATNLRAMAGQLNIGLDGLVFVDDNPVERDRVRSELPEVTVLDLPSDPALHRRTLLDCPWFDTLTLTAEDYQRSKLYIQQRQREELETTATSLDEFYASLHMVVNINLADDLTIPRVAQLTEKTNQFNLTTRRYSEAQIRALCSDNTYRVYTLAVRDRFGDEGIVGVAITERRPQEHTWYLDTFLMSCRVIGRTVETALLSYITQEAWNDGATSLLAEFMPTLKNLPARDFLPTHDFKPPAEPCALWRLDKGNVPSIPPWIQIQEIGV
jgi:FkbH-like protein